MKRLSMLLLLLSAVSLLGAERDYSRGVLDVATSEIPRLLTSANEHIGVYVIADTTVGGGDEILGEILTGWHGQAISEEMIASYREVNGSSRTISAEDIKGVTIVAADRFMENGRINWTKLRDEHRDVQAIVRLSRPAMDRSGTYAVVRFEVVTAENQRFAAFYEFSKQSDGSWRRTRANVGTL